MSDAVWVPVNAEMKGFLSTLVKEASGAGKQASQTLEKELSAGGKRAGQAAADGLTSQAAKIEQYTAKLNSARTREAQAIADVKVKEQELASLRDSGSAKASQLAQAEQQLQTAKDKQSQASAQIAREEQNIETVRQGGQGTCMALSRAEDNLASARIAQETASGKLNTAELKLEEARANQKSKSDAVATAEQNLSSVRDQYGAKSKEAAAAEKQLETAKRQAEQANLGVARAEGTVTKARAELASATDKVNAKTLTHKGVQQDVANAEKRAGDEAQSAGSKIRGLGKDMDSASNSGNGFSTGLGSFAKKAALAGGAFLGVSSATSALSMGFDRLNNLQRADIMFRNIGLSADQTKDQMSQINDVITGTSVSMSDAASTASMLMQAGVEAGKPLNDSIKALTNISAIAGGSAQDVGLVLMQIKAAGKLMGGDAMQLQQRGVNIYGYLAESLGKSFEEVKKMGESGAISYEMVIDAINAKTGDLSKEMGETLPAKMGNFKTAVANLSAGLIEPLIGPATQVVGALTTKLKEITPTVKEFAQDAVGAIKEFITFVQDHQTEVAVLGTAFVALAAGAKAYAIQQQIMAAGGIVKFLTSATKATWLFNAAMWASPVTWITAAIVAAGVALWAFFTKTETGRKMWAQLVEAFKSGWDWIKNAFSTGWDYIGAGIDKAKSWFHSMHEAWNQTSDGFKSGVDGVKNWWQGLVDGFQSGVDKVKNFFSNVKAAWEELTTAFKGGDFGYGGLAGLIGADKAEWAVNAIGSVKGAFSELKQMLTGGDLADGWQNLANIFGVENAEKIFGFITGVRQRFADMVSGVKTAVAPLMMIWDSVVALWEASISYGMDIIRTIFSAGWENVKQVAAAAWLVLVSIFTGNFSQIGTIVSNAWNNIKANTAGAFDQIKQLATAWAVGTAMTVLQMWENLKIFFMQGVNAVTALWGQMTDWVASKWDQMVQWVIDTATTWASEVAARAAQLYTDVSTWIEQLPGRVQAAFMTMVSQAIAQVQDWYNRTTQTVLDMVNQVIDYVNELPSKIQGIFANAGEWLVSAGRNMINGLWNGMKSAWTSVENWLNGIKDKASNIFSNITDRARSVNAGTSNADGSFQAYVDGGIRAAEVYANGGGHLPSQATIERPHGARGLVQWAEASTGGELFAPVDQLKAQTPRAMAIMAAGADMAGAMLVDKKTGQPVGGGYTGSLGPTAVAAFADGGITADDLRTFVEGGSVNGQQASGSLEGWPYNNYPSDPNAWGDCSYTQGKIAALAAGVSTSGRHFATGTEAQWLSSNGFHRGRGEEGDLRIGFKNGGPGGGHTAGTLPDGTNVEMGGGRGNGQIGGPAAGAWDSYFDTFFYMPITPPIQIDTSMSGMDPVAINARRASSVGASASTYKSTSAMGSESTQEVVNLSPREAALATAANELGDQSLLDVITDGLFDMAGMGSDSIVRKLLTSKGSDLFPKGDSIITTKTVENPRTSVAADHAEMVEANALANADPARLAKSEQFSVQQEPRPKADWGEEFFAFEIARAAKDKGLPLEGAMIGEAVALVESGSPLKMWANNAVPASLKFKHDAVGSDYDSVGLFQQRDNGAWGTVEQRMDPFESAKLFFGAMLSKFPDWQSMDPGAVAQGVQVSAFPDRYAGQMGRGRELAQGSGVFDMGGVGNGVGVMQKDVIAPERVLSPEQTRSFDHLVFEEMPKHREGEGGLTVVINVDGQEVMRQRVEAVEGQVEINTDDIEELKSSKRVPTVVTTRGGGL